MLKMRYVGALTNRMRVDDYIRQHPVVLETPIKRPVIILGLVRTGTILTSNSAVLTVPTTAFRDGETVTQ